jgi:hypothetical protein
MKGFIKKIIVFLSLAILAIIAIVISSNYIIESQSSFKIDDDITKLVIGHSHSECSVNDSILKNSINLSSSGESYFYNYQKLKKVVSDNDQINTIFIEFTNNQVDSMMDDWIWNYEKMSNFLHFYTPFIDFEDLKLLLKNNPTDFLASYSIATRKHFYRILSDDYDLIDEIGGYKDKKLSKVDKLIANNEFNSDISKNHSLSENNISYLRKMIDLCRENNINTFLIRSPQHALYADLSNEPIYQNVLKTQFKDIELLDFDTMNFPSSHYFDLDHLNYKGAKEFTTLFNNLIENNLLNSANKQSLIDTAINDFNKTTN